MIDTTPKYPKEHVFLDGALTDLMTAVYDAGWFDRNDAMVPKAQWHLFKERLLAANGDLTRVDVWEMDAHQVPAWKEEA